MKINRMQNIIFFIEEYAIYKRNNNTIKAKGGILTTKGRISRFFGTIIDHCKRFAGIHIPIDKDHTYFVV